MSTLLQGARITGRSRGIFRIEIPDLPMSAVPNAKAILDKIKINDDSAAYHPATDFTTPGYVDAKIATATNLGASSLATEASVRASADVVNAAAITTESASRVAGDAANIASILAEATTRASADVTNASAISAETSARQSAVTSEANTRSAADAVLTSSG